MQLEGYFGDVELARLTAIGNLGSVNKFSKTVPESVLEPETLAQSRCVVRQRPDYSETYVED